MRKKDFLEWNTLVTYIKENIMNNQNFTQDMIQEIKILLEYIGSGIDSDEKIDYADLLEVIKQCQGMIDDTVKGKEYLSENEKFSDVCNCIRLYFNMVFGKPKESYISGYYDKPATISTNVSINVPAKVYEQYTDKMDAIKKEENIKNYRSFTLTGAFSTYLLAVTKGLIDFKKVGNQMCLVARDGMIGTEKECGLSDS